MKVIVLPLSLMLVGSAGANELIFESGGTLSHDPTLTVAANLRFGEQTVGYDALQFVYECGIEWIRTRWRNPSQVIPQCLVVNEYSHFDWGIGLAKMEHNDQWNSGAINASVLLRYRITPSFSFSYRHLSNGGTQTPNIGRNLLLFGWTF